MYIRNPPHAHTPHVQACMRAYMYIIVILAYLHTGQPFAQPPPPPPPPTSSRPPPPPPASQPPTPTSSPPKPGDTGTITGRREEHRVRGCIVALASCKSVERKCSSETFCCIDPPEMETPLLIGTVCMVPAAYKSKHTKFLLK